MNRKDIKTLWDRETRNDINDNFKQLFDEYGNVIENISDEAFQQVIEGSKIDWSQMVDTVSSLPSNAVEGETRGVSADNKIYRYDGTNWVPIAEINLNPISEVDTRLNNKIDDGLNSVNTQLAQIATNVKTFGAKGDGITDDIVAIQGAIDYVASNGGGTVYFPKGEYHISDTIEITGDNIMIIGEGYGSHIHTTNDLTAFVASGYDNLTWMNLRITGVRTTNAYNGYGSGIIVSNANKPRVENCFFENLMAKAVFYAGYHSAYGGNLDQGVHDGWVVNNHIDWCGDGIMVYNDGQRVEISGNMMFRCVNIGVYIDDSHQVQGVEIPRKSTRINVENNYFEDMMGTTAINFAGTDYSSARGNYILNGGQLANKNINAISIQTVQNHVPARNNIIEGNTIVGQTNIAIDLVGASNNIIRNNNMVNNSLNRPSGNAPTIKMQSNTIRDVIFGSSQNIIENNLSLSNDPNSNTSVHVMIDDAECMDNVIRYNVFNGGTHFEPITNRGTNTIQKDNLFNGALFHNGFEDGSRQEPSFYFSEDRDTGFYRVSEGDVGFSSNGEWTLRFRNGMQFNNGNDVQFGTGTGSRFGSSPLQKFGFWGSTPVAQPENIPQTSGATLVELEQEVNKLKFMLKTIGLMS